MTHETAAEYFARQARERAVASAARADFEAEVAAEFVKSRGSGRSVQERKRDAYDAAMMRRAERS